MRIVYTIEECKLLYTVPSDNFSLGKVCISTWCFSGIDEWLLILEKLKKDMAQYFQQ